MAEVQPGRLASVVYRWVAGGGDASWLRRCAATVAVGVLAVVSVPLILLVSLIPAFAIAAAGRHLFPETHHSNLPPYSPLAIAASILVYGAIGLAVGVWSARRRERRETSDEEETDQHVEARAPA